MSRESAAACPLTADEQPLLAIARLAPERSVLDLREASTHVNHPARLAMFHWASCPRCSPAALRGEPDGLCKRGRHLLSRAHSWRARAGEEGGGARPGDTIASARASACGAGRFGVERPRLEPDAGHDPAIPVRERDRDDIVL